MIKYQFASETTEWSDENVCDLNLLLNQLSSHTRPLNRLDLRFVAAHSRLLFALHQEPERSNESIIGMATLAPVAIPTGIFGHIEDVVVVEHFRGKGIGRELTQRLIEEARAMSMRHVDLTSNPSRTAANQLYRSMGFQQWETNVYRFNLKPDDSR